MQTAQPLQVQTKHPINKENAREMALKSHEARRLAAASQGNIQEYIDAKTKYGIKALHQLAAIAFNELTDKSGKHIEVPIKVRHLATESLVDRAFGKPQQSIDMTSAGRPITFDAAFADDPKTPETLLILDGDGASAHDAMGTDGQGSGETMGQGGHEAVDDRQDASMDDPSHEAGGALDQSGIGTGSD